MTAASTSAREQAVAWFVRLQAPDATAQDWQACAQWQAADPEHARQFQLLQQIWQTSAALPDTPLTELRAAQARAVSQPRRRQLSWGLALAGAAALSVGGWQLLQAPAAPRYARTWETLRGEQRSIDLPDGSQVVLNTDSQLALLEDTTQRRVVLQRGEAWFQVAHDAARPFIVEAGPALVRVTGTQFVVRHDTDDVRVDVASGSVLVRQRAWWRTGERQLQAGQAVLLSATDGLGPVAPVPVQQVAGWTRGTLRFDGVPLAQVVAEINRYLPVPATLDAPRLRGYRLSALFDLQAPERLLARLPDVAPVRIERQAGGGIRIVAN